MGPEPVSVRQRGPRLLRRVPLLGWIGLFALLGLGTAVVVSRPTAQAGPSASAAASAVVGSGSPSLVARSPSPIHAPSASATETFGPPSAEPLPSDQPPSPGSLQALLAGIPIAVEDRTGYARSLFRLWIDADHDGCDTRREVLLAEALVAPTTGAGCRLTGGRWKSPYDGLVFTDAARLDIDHVVPLAEAWDSGASAWTATRRRAYANDLEVPWALIAVSASSNRSKGDQDPAEWLPPSGAFACTYAADWIAVKVRWALAADPAEVGALHAVIDDCPATTLSVPIAP